MQDSDGYYYTYDAEGNRTAQYENSHGPSLDSYATDITSYTWDGKNELTSVKHQSTYGGSVGWEIDYAYDAFGRMVSPDADGRFRRAN